MEKSNSLDENAKDEWMKLVKEVKKKQKGLPALTKIKTNAGNVEHNVAMFNKINSPIEGPSNNPISGPFGGDISCDSSAMGESITTHENLVLEEVVMDNEVFELHYEDLPVEGSSGGSRYGYFDRNFGNWLPKDRKEETHLINWTYKVTTNDIIEVLQDLPEVQQELDIENISEEEFNKKLIDNLEHLAEKYEDKLLEYFEEYAIEDARKHADFNESLKTGKAVLDDSFDLSLRTLL